MPLNDGKRFRVVPVALPAAAILFLASTMFAQPPQNPADAGYEITAHRVLLKLYPDQHGLECADTLTLRLVRPRKEKIQLGLASLYDVRDVTVNGRPREIERGRDGITLRSPDGDTSATIAVRYSGIFPERTEYSRFTADEATLREEEFLPFGPHGEQSVRLSVSLPRGWDVVTVGNRVLVDSLRDSTTIVRETDRPVPFIGWVCAGRFRRVVDEGGPVPVSISLQQGDTASVTGLLVQARDALSYYGRAFSKYRFTALNIVEVDDRIAGTSLLAVALPSFIMVKRLAFSSPDRFNRVDAVLAHEIAHQWWPITVHIDDDDAAFLSEGMCEYSSMLFSEATGLRTPRDSLKSHPLLRPLLARAERGEDLPLRMKADLRSIPTQYLKSSYVHNMLRRLIGDSAFLQLYREYAERFALKRAGMNDFRALAEELSGKKLSWFFDQWVNNKGIPRFKLYNVKSARTSSGWVTKGRVRLSGYEKFTALIDVGVETSGGITTSRVTVGVDSAGVFRNDVPFEVATSLKPVRAILDPGSDVLKMQRLAVKIGDLRDPGDGLMIVGTGGKGRALAELAAADSAIMDRAGWSIRIMADSAVTLGDLQRGKIILYGTAGENLIVKNLEDKFPIRMKGDSVIVDGKAVHDPSLALIESIENPYDRNGTICWVAPCSPSARPQLVPFDASWVVVRGVDEIAGGTWDVTDHDLEVEVP